MDDGFVSTDAKWGENFFEVRVPSSNEIVRIYHSYWRGEEKPQREWQGLTENEIKHLWYEACQTNLELTSQLIVHLARNVEAKLKENNCVVLSKECYERGCAAYDDRVDEGVMVPKEKNSD